MPILFSCTNLTIESRSFLLVLALKHLWRCHLVAIMKSVILDSWQSYHLSGGAPSTQSKSSWKDCCGVWYDFLISFIWKKKRELLAKKKSGFWLATMRPACKNCFLAGEAANFISQLTEFHRIAWVCLDRRSKICAAFSRTCWSIPWRRGTFMEVLDYWQTPKEAFHGIHWNTVIIHN